MQFHNWDVCKFTVKIILAGTKHRRILKEKLWIIASWWIFWVLFISALKDIKSIQISRLTVCNSAIHEWCMWWDWDFFLIYVRNICRCAIEADRVFKQSFNVNGMVYLRCKMGIAIHIFCNITDESAIIVINEERSSCSFSSIITIV